MSSLFALLAQRSWVALSGLVTTVLVTLCLTAELQGWYYAFVGLVMLYSLFDLGLAQVLISISSKLQHPKVMVTSDLVTDQFKSLLHQAARRYGWLASIFLLIMIPTGILFFWSGTRDNPIPYALWLWQWIVLVAVTSASMLLTPYLSMIEGAGNVAEVALLRLTQGLIGSMACWAMLWFGFGLWALVMVPLVGVLITVMWLKLRFALLLTVALDVTNEMARSATKRSLSWAKEVWPLQWRFGVGWFTSYMLTQIYTPILFYLSGSIVAGQMGVSFAIANMLAVISNSWISRHVPAMTQAALAHDWKTLDSIFRRDLVWSTLFFIVSAVVICFAHQLLDHTAYGERLLPLGPFVGLLTISLINHLTGTFAAQLRSFQKEPLMRIMLLGACMIVPLTVWAAYRYAATGVIVAILSVQINYVLPATLYTWKKFRQESKGWIGAVVK